MAYDHYAAARDLEVDLRSAGFGSWADRIESTIAGGSTGTEIMMGLRWQLNQLIASEPDLPGHLRANAQRLHSEIDRVL